MALESVSLVSPSRYAPQLPWSLSPAYLVCAFGAHTSIGASVKPSASMSLAPPSDCYHHFVSPPSIAPSLSALCARAPFSAPPKVSATQGTVCCSGSLPSAVRLGFPSKGGMADDTIGLLKPSDLRLLFQQVNDIMRKLLSGDLGIGIGDFDTISEYEQVAFIPYISAGDPDLSTTAQALKVLDSCGSDIIELGVPYSDPLADGPVIQAAATRSLARGSNFDAITSMLKVVLQLSSPVASFSDCNPILKLGVKKLMSILNDAGVQGQRPSRVYDVFISYKQVDMLHPVSHLNSALKRREIKPFVDFALDKGVEIRLAIYKAIKQSEIAVVIVSPNFHSSPWCLNELVKILECQKKWGLVVLPIFWGTDPKGLRDQSRFFVENIGQGEMGFKQENPRQVRRWRDALRALGMINGWSVSSSSDKTEADVIEDLADKISAKLNP